MAMHLWLAPHDERVRALKAGGILEYGFAKTPLGGCSVLKSHGHLLALSFMGGADEGIVSFETTWRGSLIQRTSEADSAVPSLLEHPGSLPVMAVGTPFQLTVWEFLCRIPEGETLTYGEVAAGIGRPRAARAVGQAAGANRIAVVIPCHRVVSRGKLTGYRWGIDRKRALLSLELSRRDPLRMPF